MNKTVLVDMDTYNAIKAEAKKEDRSMSKMVKILVEKGIKASKMTNDLNNLFSEFIAKNPALSQTPLSSATTYTIPTDPPTADDELEEWNLPFPQPKSWSEIEALPPDQLEMLKAFNERQEAIKKAKVRRYNQQFRDKEKEIDAEIDKLCERLDKGEISNVEWQDRIAELTTEKKQISSQCIDKWPPSEKAVIN